MAGVFSKTSCDARLIPEVHTALINTAASDNTSSKGETRTTRKITPKITHTPVPIFTRHSLIPLMPPEYQDIPVSAFCLADNAASVSVYSYFTVMAFFVIASSSARAIRSSETLRYSCIRRIRLFIKNVPPTSIAVRIPSFVISLPPVSSSMIYFGSSMPRNGSRDVRRIFTITHPG